MDCVEHVARLGVAAEAGARAEGEELGCLGGGQAVCEQDQPCLRVLDAELADLGEIGQRSGVDDQHVRAVGPQALRQAFVGNVLRHDRHGRVVGQQRLKAKCEQVIETGDRDRDGRACGHGRGRAREAPVPATSARRRPRVSPASPVAHPVAPPRFPLLG